MTLSGLIGAVLQLACSKANDLSVSHDDLVLNPQEQFSPGTGDNQLDILFHDMRTLAGGANESLDLAGSLTDVFGVTVAFAKIKVLLIRNLSTTQTLSIGGGANSLHQLGGRPHRYGENPAQGHIAAGGAPGGICGDRRHRRHPQDPNSATNPCDYQIALAGTSA